MNERFSCRFLGIGSANGLDGAYAGRNAANIFLMWAASGWAAPGRALVLAGLVALAGCAVNRAYLPHTLCVCDGTHQVKPSPACEIENDGFTKNNQSG